MPDPETKVLASRMLESRRPAEYVAPGPLDEILHEQLDYLIAHSAASCAPGCSDCVRLQQVQGWLLLPFRGNRRNRKRPY
jgi:hypothetical protein